jgi:hypothetical protein
MRRCRDGIDGVLTLCDVQVSDFLAFSVLPSPHAGITFETDEGPVSRDRQLVSSKSSIHSP